MSVSVLDSEHPVRTLKDAVHIHAAVINDWTQHWRVRLPKAIWRWPLLRGQGEPSLKRSYGFSFLRHQLHIPHQETGGLGMTWWLLKGFPAFPDSPLFFTVNRSMPFIFHALSFISEGLSKWKLANILKLKPNSWRGKDRARSKDGENEKDF